MGNEHIFTHILFSLLVFFFDLPFYVLLLLPVLLSAKPLSTLFSPAKAQPYGCDSLLFVSLQDIAKALLRRDR
jgi:hypothetical protein